MASELKHEEPTRESECSRMARPKRQYGTGCLIKRRKGWVIRWRELEIAPDGTLRKVLRYEALDEMTKKQASERHCCERRAGPRMARGACRSNDRITRGVKCVWMAPVDRYAVAYENFVPVMCGFKLRSSDQRRAGVHRGL